MLKLRGAKIRPKNIEICRKTGTEKIYYREAKGPRVRLPGPLHSAAFRAAYDVVKAGYPNAIPQLEGPKSPRYAETETRRRLSVALKSCQARAAKRGWAFELDAAWLDEQLAQQGYCCALTGIPFFTRFRGKTKVHPFTPSIDRINSKHGYTRANARLVVFAVNAMMMDWGEEVFAQVARAYRGRQTAQRYNFPAQQMKINEINCLGDKNGRVVGGTVKR